MNPAIAKGLCGIQPTELLKDEFACEPRGTVTIEGKGEMETWYLVGRSTRNEQPKL